MGSDSDKKLTLDDLIKLFDESSTNNWDKPNDINEKLFYSLFEWKLIKEKKTISKGDISYFQCSRGCCDKEYVAKDNFFERMWGLIYKYNPKTVVWERKQTGWTNNIRNYGCPCLNMKDSRKILHIVKSLQPPPSRMDTLIIDDDNE